MSIGVSWIWSNYCNMKCIHCYAIQYGLAERTAPETEQAFEIIDKLAADDIKGFSLAGGEVLVHPQVFKVCEHAAAWGMRVRICTNGRLLTKEVLTRLIDCGVTDFSISLDSPNADIHNYIRRDNSAFKCAIRAIEACLEADLGARWSIIRRPSIWVSSLMLTDALKPASFSTSSLLLQTKRGVPGCILSL